METIIVKAMKSGEELEAQYPVLIDGVRNGYTNHPITIDSGVYDIAIDERGSEEIVEEVEGTTENSPMEIKVWLWDK